VEEVGVFDAVLAEGVIFEEVGFSDVVAAVVDCIFFLFDAPSSLVVSSIYASSITLIGSVRNVEGYLAVCCCFIWSYDIQPSNSVTLPMVP
jgi:hypothetical protein